MTTCNSAFGEHGAPTDLGQIQVGPLLGSGSFGKVYRGIVDGHSVAVKVIDYRNRKGEDLDAKTLAEIKLQKDLEHPGVVRLHSSGVSYDENDSQKVTIMWMVQEYCDMGNLTSAAECGWLRQERSIEAPPCMPVIIPTLADLAGGMAYLHERNIIHADLTGRNVLLARSDARAHGFAAKVSDFGLARVTPDGAPLCTSTLGTITHMPPELLLSNLLYTSADVWAFGIIAWEAYHGKQAYGGKNPAQITLSVVKNRPVPWPEDAPQEFVSLIKEKCLAFNQEGRWPFAEIAPAMAKLEIGRAHV